MGSSEGLSINELKRLHSLPILPKSNLENVEKLHGVKTGLALGSLLRKISEIRSELPLPSTKKNNEDLLAEWSGKIDISRRLSPRKSIADIRVLAAGLGHKTAPGAIAVYIRHKNLEGEVGIKIKADRWMFVKNAHLKLDTPEKKQAFAQVMRFLEGSKIKKIIESKSRGRDQVVFKGINETPQDPARF
ncbi:hypothetical protein HY989_04070 [Candidatus Micrarchaeota archaeon]|nr:hypothetical protein [Candidatus Micrarchaeota archaeon]